MGGVSYVNDLWTLEIELLGMEKAGEELVSMAAYAEPPFAIGVFGRWGSGKTSLMRYAMARLGGQPLMISLPTVQQPQEEFVRSPVNLWNQLRNKEPRISHLDSIRSVWFNPWQYQNEPNPLIPLLHEIRSQMSFWLRSFEKAEKLVRVSVESGIELLGNLIDVAGKLRLGENVGIGGWFSKTREKGERYEKERYDTRTDSQRFSLLFEEAVSKVLGGENNHRRLVIFIDDLDRCEDGHILHLLESIKLYLNTRYCTFVLGLDPGAVERALGKIKEKSSFEIREYLEKLFQGVVHVPTRGNYQKFIEALIKKYQLINNGQNGRGQEETESDVDANPDGDPASNGGDNSLTEEETKLAKVLCQLLEPNPRKVKNFINSFRAAWTARSGQNPNHLNPARFAAFLYLKLYHPDVYRSLEYQPNHFQVFLNVLLEQWEEAWRENWKMAAFYAHAFRHVLEFGRLDQEPRSSNDLAAIESAYTAVSGVLERHNCDLELKKVLREIFPVGELGSLNIAQYLRI